MFYVTLEMYMCFSLAHLRGPVRRDFDLCPMTHLNNIQRYCIFQNQYLMKIIKRCAVLTSLVLEFYF